MAKNNKTHPLISALADRHLADISETLIQETNREPSRELPFEMDELFYKSVQRAWFRNRLKGFFSLFFSLLLIAAVLFTCWFLPYRWSQIRPPEESLPVNYTSYKVNTKYIDDKGFIYFGINKEAGSLPVLTQEGYTPLTVSDCDGYFILEQNESSLTWFLKDQKIVMELKSDYLSKEELVSLAEKLTQQARG